MNVSSDDPQAYLDPEFQAPHEKAPPIDAPPSRLAVVSLVFGIIGFLLPLIAPLVAIVTGHVAQGEIRSSRGRLGGASLAKAGLILGYIWLISPIFIAAAAIALLTTRTSVVDHVDHVGNAIRLPPDGAVPDEPRHDFRAEPGVKLSNEMTPSYANWFEDAGLTSDAEPILCAYELDTNAAEPVELAVVTSRHVYYVKGDRVTTVPLKEIDAIVHGDEYVQDYLGGKEDRSPRSYPIAIERAGGPLMRIQVEPESDGPVFAKALTDAWETARNRPDEAEVTAEVKVESESASRAESPSSSASVEVIEIEPSGPRGDDSKPVPPADAPEAPEPPASVEPPAAEPEDADSKSKS